MSPRLYSSQTALCPEIMKFITAHLLTLFVYIISATPPATASTIKEESSTPELMKIEVTPFPGEIILREISFKNTEQDFLSFLVESSSQTINLKGLNFYDDKDFKTIDQDYRVNDGTLITLYFNSSEKDDPGKATLHTEKSGLTSTTEQLLIHNKNEVLDFFCWQKDPVAKSETTDFAKILANFNFGENDWEDSDIGSCFSSEKVKNDQTIYRISEEKNASAWDTEAPKTLDDANASTSTAPDASSPTSATSSGAASPTTSSKTASSSALQDLISSSAESGSDFQDILLVTEIFPAPANKDQSEWIELLNTGETDLNLTGWIIDDSEGGSKPKTIPSLTAKSQTPLKLELKTLKINLNNDRDQIRIFEPDGTPVIEQDYDETQKGMSYSLITIDGESQWEWLTPSPGELNMTLDTITGTISLAPQFADQYFFALETEDNEKIMVLFDEELIKAPLAKELFQPGKTGRFSGQLDDAPGNKNGYSLILKLHDYELDPTDAITSLDWPPFIIIATIGLLLSGAYFFHKYQNKWKQSPSDNCL